jgi:hypothetical protein
MDEDTQWFYEMLRVVLEIARPNTVVDDENKAFLQDMLHGIGKSLRGRRQATGLPNDVYMQKAIFVRSDRRKPNC